MYRLTFDERHGYGEDGRPHIAVPIVLSANDVIVKLSPKLDTGADFCLFDRKWADFLRISVESGRRQTFRGLMGSFYAYEHEITIRTFDIEFVSRVYFAGGLNVARDLLGRNGWLDRFRVGIVHYDRELYLSAYES